jgi:hypothetical protein
MQLLFVCREGDTISREWNVSVLSGKLLFLDRNDTPFISLWGFDESESPLSLVDWLGCDEFEGGECEWTGEAFEVAGEGFLLNSVEAGEKLSADADASYFQAALCILLVPKELDYEEGIDRWILTVQEFGGYKGWFF